MTTSIARNMNRSYHHDDGTKLCKFYIYIYWHGTGSYY